MHRPLAAVALMLGLLAPAPAFAQESATPTVPVFACPPVPPTISAEVARRPGTAGAFIHDVTVRVTGTPNGSVALDGYTRPGTRYGSFGTIALGPDGRGSKELVITGNTRFFAYGPPECAAQTVSTVALVQTRIGGIFARRVEPRRYTFQGFVDSTADKVLNLYRVTPTGQRVLTQQTRKAGEHYFFDRRFLGSGRFDFFVSAGDDINSLGAESPRRPTVIH